MNGRGRIVACASCAVFFCLGFFAGRLPQPLMVFGAVSFSLALLLGLYLVLGERRYTRHAIPQPDEQKPLSPPRRWVIVRGPPLEELNRSLTLSRGSKDRLIDEGAVELLMGDGSKRRVRILAITERSREELEIECYDPLLYKSFFAHYSTLTESGNIVRE